MMNPRPKVCAVVVTHNRRKLLQDCISSLRRQTRPPNEILIVNNGSTDGTSEWLEQQRDLIVLEQENVGCAGGQYSGISTAYNRGNDWFWCMDDDVELDKRALEELLGSPHASDERTGALVCSVRNAESVISMESVIRCNKLFNGLNISLEEFNKPSLKVSAYPLLGILVRRRAVAEVGNVNREFFLYSDDIDFTLRISDKFEVWLIRDSVLIHKAEAAVFVSRKIFGRTYHYVDARSHWKEYYAWRNYLYLVYSRLGLLSLLSVIFSNTKTFIKNIVLADFRMIRLSVYVRALRDALLGRLGKTIDPVEFRMRFPESEIH